MQKIGIPTIGNPVLKLENKVLTLVYSVMQHQINCDLYDGLVIEDVGDKGLQAQLIGLYEMTNILSLKYHEYLEEWANLKSETGKQLLKFDKLSIPA